jgi:hypothetical protein
MGRSSTWNRLVFVSVFPVLLAAPAFGYRREYIVTSEGARKPGSEVCFYRGTSPSDAFSLYFTYDKAGCLPADAVVDLPRGLFHVFARHSDGYVSGFDDFFVYQGPPAPEQGYGRLEIPLQPAARVDVSDVLSRLERGQRVGVWLAPTERESGTYLPLIDGESEILVPAGRPFLPLIAANGVPVAVGDPLTLTAGARTKFRPFGPLPSQTDLVGWLKVAPIEGTLPSAALAPAEVALETAGGTIEPVFPLFAGAGATHTLMFFKGAPAGPAQLTVRGRTWVHSDIDVDIGRGVTVLKAPIVMVPGAAVSVHWNAEVDATPQEACGGEDNPVSSMTTVTLMSCVLSAEGASTCTPVAKRSVPFAAGAADFDGVPAGRYTIEIEPPVAKKVQAQADLAVGEVEEIAVALAPFRFFGTVAVNGKPVQALLVFASGSARSDSTGRYDAVLAADPLTNHIGIVLCADGRTLTYTPEERIPENSSYDITVREQELVATVVDATSGAPVSGATVTFSPYVSNTAGQSIQYTSAGLSTDAEGRAAFSNIPSGKALVLCATRESYVRTCGERMSPSDVKKGKATISLVRTLSRGRIVGHDGSGLIAFVDELGQVTEEASVETGGTFSIQRVHTPREHVVYASTSRPLVLLPITAEALSGDELVFTLPSAPLRSFAVTVQGMSTKNGYVGLWIGGRYVPLDMLVFHGDSRGEDVVVERGRAVVIRDITETGPLAVAFVPDVPQAPGPFVDPFTRPEYRSVRRYTVAGPAMTIPAE